MAWEVCAISLVACPASEKPAAVSSFETAYSLTENFLSVYTKCDQTHTMNAIEFQSLLK